MSGVCHAAATCQKAGGRRAGCGRSLLRSLRWLPARTHVLGLHAQALLLKHDRASGERADHAVSLADGVAAREQQLLQLLAFVAAQARIISRPLRHQRPATA